jgi:hypothetical protein
MCSFPEAQETTLILAKAQEENSVLLSTFSTSQLALGTNAVFALSPELQAPVSLQIREV